MANIVHRWKKVLAAGCSHGELANKDIQKQILAFKAKFKPDRVVELGDLVDTAAFRSGARGTPDEGKKPEPDEFSAISWLDRFEPTDIIFGNHCWRLVELQNSTNAIVSYAASKLWNAINDKARKLKAKTVDYDIQRGWIEIGGVHYGHGYMYGMHALRDHAEMVGGPVVMAHLHAAQQVNGRTIRNATSYCVGCVADIPSMTYARRRRQTLSWSHGCVWGYYSDKSSQLYLTSCPPGGKLMFPL